MSECMECVDDHKMVHFSVMGSLSMIQSAGIMCRKTLHGLTRNLLKQGFDGRGAGRDVNSGRLQGVSK